MARVVLVHVLETVRDVEIPVVLLVLDALDAAIVQVVTVDVLLGVLDVLDVVRIVHRHVKGCVVMVVVPSVILLVKDAAHRADLIVVLAVLDVQVNVMDHAAEAATLTVRRRAQHRVLQLHT